MASNFESGMFHKEPAWHGLGTVVESKVYSSLEAMKLAGLNWTVRKEPTYINVNGLLIENKELKAIVRSSDNSILGNCSNRYRPLQNEEAFAFFDPYLHEKDCFISTAGSLAGGKKIFITAEIEGNLQEVVEGDVVKKYLLLATSHDGSIGITIKFVNERVVCNNTLDIALAEKSAYKTIRHSANAIEQLEAIHNSIDIYRRTFTEELSLYKDMAKKEITTNEFKSYLEELFAIDIKNTSERLGKDAELTEVRSTRKILQNFNGSPTLQMDGVRGTVWAAHNAVSEFITHQKSSDQDSRINSIWFGQDGLLLNKSKDMCLALV